MIIKISEIAEMLEHAAKDTVLTSETLRCVMHDAAKAIGNFYDMPEHNTDSANCWCNPNIETDPATGNKVIVHKDITV